MCKEFYLFLLAKELFHSLCFALVRNTEFGSCKDKPERQIQEVGGDPSGEDPVTAAILEMVPANDTDGY